MQANGVKHICTPPYHSSSNGLVERAVQTLKGLRKLKNGSLEIKLSRFLFSYGSMPHSTTGLSPAELMFGRRLHSPLDNLCPSLERKVHQEQERQKSTHDRRARPREFVLGDLVYAQNYGPGAKWLPGEVSGVLGSTMFEVKLTDGRMIRRHADQMRSRAPAEGVTKESNGNTDEGDDFDIRIPNTPENSGTSTPDPQQEQLENDSSETETPRVNSEMNDQNESGSPHNSSESEATEANTNTSQPSVRRSNRTRNPPNYFSQDQSLSGMFT